MIVIDLSRSVAGAFCARLLAHRGDQVIAVGALLPVRGEIENDTDWVSAYLRSGVELFDGDAPALLELVACAEVAITGWNAGRPNHEVEIRAANRSLVEVSVSTFGTYGPYAELKGSPLLDWASGGHLYITGLPTREPLSGPATLPAYVAGYVAASAVEIGLLLRNQGHEDVRLDVSTMEVMASSHQTLMSQYAATGEIRKRQKHPIPTHPFDIVECADGWVCVATLTDAQFDMFAALIGDPRLVTDERFATGRSRHEHAEEFDLVVHDWFVARTAEEAVEQLQTHHVPAAKLANPVTVLEDPQLQSRRFWVPWSDGTRTGRMPGDPFRVIEADTPAEPQHSVPGRNTTKDLPLDGLVVVDMTEYWAGPMATRTLGDLGATVVRIERPEPRLLNETTAPFLNWKMHRGKRRLPVDMKTESGRRVIHDLMKQADVFVENFTPGVMDRLGIAYKEVAKINPSIVYVSLSGFGQDGPRSSWASFGPILESASSLQSRTKYADSIPLLLGQTLPDPVGCYAAVHAVLNRLRARRVTGRGAYIDIAQLETYSALSAEEILRASVQRTVSPTVPGRRRVFACRGEDAWVAIDAIDDDVEIVSKALRCDESEDSMALAIAKLDKFEVAFLLQARGVSAFPVADAADLASDRHFRERGFMMEINIRGKLVSMPTLPIRGRPEIARIVPADASQHDELFVLRDVLGYNDDVIDNLLSSGAITIRSS